LGQFATGVTVVTVELEGELHGMTANTFTSVSLDPPLVLFCVAKRARMAGLIAGADAFAVSILSAEQEHVSRQFAGSANGREIAAPLRRGLDTPVLGGALAALSCHVEARHDAGDHIIVVGRVLQLYEAEDVPARPPLVFFRSRYANLVEHEPDAAQPSETWSNDAIRIHYDEWSDDDGPQSDDDRQHPW
jgi:flavin reductase (DIM6/NTAB) family NADH-FMN oxidoreductase RutF